MVSQISVDETWKPLWGKTEMARDHYNQYIYRLSEREQDGRQLEWIIRVFNDGVAFRYRFTEDSGFGEFKLTGEKTAFSLDPSHISWSTNHQHYYSSQEHTYDKRPVGEIGKEEC